MVNNVVVIVLTNTSIRVSWDRLQISDITYLILYSQTRKQETESTRVVPSNERSMEIKGLITGAEYKFQVVAQADVDGEIIVGKRSLLTGMSLLDVLLATHPPSTTSTGIFNGEKLKLCIIYELLYINDLVILPTAYIYKIS